MANQNTTTNMSEETNRPAMIDTTAAMVIAPPGAGAEQTIQMTPGEMIRFGFDLDAQILTLDGDNLRIEFANGGNITLEDFVSASGQGAPMMLVMEDGSTMPAGVLLTALEAELAEPAAGAGAASGGAGEYRDDLGDALTGVNKLGTQDPDAFPGLQPQAPVTDDPLAVNEPPVAVDDAYTVAEDESLTIPASGILVNDTDPESDPLTSTLVEGPQFGSLSLNEDGSFTYTPNANFNGTDSFTYFANDGELDSNIATVTITIDPVNDGPVAQDDIYAATEDTELVVGSVADGIMNHEGDPGDINGVDDFDIDGDTLTVVQAGADLADLASLNGSGSLVFTTNNDGIVTLNSDGTFTYEPVANFNGTDTFVYQISDGNGGTDTATVTIVVGAVNDGPVAQDDTYAGQEDTLLSITDPANGVLNHEGDLGDQENPANPGVPADDYDVDGDALTVIQGGADGDSLNPLSGGSIVFLTSHGGTVTLNSNGTFDYDPAPDFNGTDTFVYEISDGNGGTDTATVTIVMGAQNDGPIARDDTYVMNEDGVLFVNAASGTLVHLDPGETVDDFDPEGDPLTVIAVNGGPIGGPIVLAHGVLNINSNGSFNFTPNPEFSGQQQFEYTITDGNGGFDTATVTIIVNNVNDPPIARDDAYQGQEDTLLSVNAASGVLSHLDGAESVDDVDPDGGTLSVTAVNGGSIAGPIALANGTLNMNSNGSFTFQPNANFSGQQQFNYTITDGQGGFDTATVTITVGETPDPPQVDLDANDSTNTGFAYSGNFTEGGGPVPIADSDSAVTDIDSANMSQMTVTLTNAQDGAAETLSVVEASLPAGISVSGNGTQALTFTGLASKADYETALELVRYNNTSESPDTTTRTINVQVTDDTAQLSNTATAFINMGAQDDPPVIDLDANDSTAAGYNYATTFVEDGGAVAIADADSLITDVDSANMTQMTVTLTNYPDGTAEALSVSGVLPAGISVISSNNGHTLTFSGTASKADYETALEQVRYNNTSQDPDTTNRTVNVQVTDDTGQNSNTAVATITMQAQNDPPVIDLDANNSTVAGYDYVTTFTEDGGAIAIADSDSLITDVDSANMSGMTVTLTNYPDGTAETLTVSGVLPAGISVISSNNGHTLTFSGSATKAAYETALEQVRYNNTSQDPDTTTREVDVQVTDDTSQASNVATAYISITPVDDPPVFSSKTDTHVSEEGLANPNADALPNPADTTNSASATVLGGTNGTVVFTDVDTDYTGNVDAITLGTSTVLQTADGVAVNFAWDAAQDALIGTRNDDPTAEVIRVTVDSVLNTNTNEYTIRYETLLTEPVTHPLNTAGANEADEDNISIALDVTVGSTNITSGLAPAAKPQAVIEDDSPLVSGTGDVTITYDIGDTETASLGISYGADGPEGPSGVLFSSSYDGTTQAISDQGGLTSDGAPVYFIGGGTTTLTATTNPGNPADATSWIFTAELNDPSDGNYEVTMYGKLDGAPVEPINLFSGTYTGGNTQEFLVMDGIDIKATAYFHLGNFATQHIIDPETDPLSDPSATVNHNANALGVDTGSKIEGDGPGNDPDDVLRLYFSDPDTHAPAMLDAVTIGFWQFTAGDTAQWKAWDGNTVVAQGSFTAADLGPGDTYVFDVDPLNLGIHFDTLEFSNSTADTNGYGLATLVVGRGGTEGIDQTVTLNFIATDDDLDSAAGSFDVTFDASESTPYEQQVSNLFQFESQTTNFTQQSMLVDDADVFAFSSLGGEGDHNVDSFDIATDTLMLTDVLDTNADSLFDANDVQVAVTVSGADVELLISGANGDTSVTLTDANSANQFDSASNLQDLIDNGLQVDFNPDTYAS